MTVAVSKRLAYSTYTTRALVTRHRLKANLGSFGRIALRFRPSTQSRAAQRLAPVPAPGSLVNRYFQQVAGCAVGSELRGGHFKGRLRFRGEDGYIRIRTRHARGFISPGTRSCSKVEQVHGVALDAKSGSLAFEAVHLRQQRGAGFLAREHTRIGRVRVGRLALGGGWGKSFTYDSELTSAHVEPVRGPFSGSADLNPSGAWTGPLAVSFPGAPDLPLAGPEFAARLARF